MGTKITIEAHIQKPITLVWESYTQPKHIVNWNFASDDWQCPRAENDLKVGGRYKARMEAKDGSFGFDFEATYIEIIPEKIIKYKLDDNREVEIHFTSLTNGTMVQTIFDAESENPIEMQKQGWQAILNNFKRHTESLS